MEHQKTKTLYFNRFFLANHYAQMLLFDAYINKSHKKIIHEGN